MKRRGNFKLAYQSLRAAKARSFLTMLGIIIGVMAVVLVVCVGQGIKQQIAGQVGDFGKNLLSIAPNNQTSDASLLSGGLPGGATNLLSQNDLSTVQRTAGIRYAVPLATATGSMRGDHGVNAPFIVATTADLPNVLNQRIDSGGFFDNNVDSKTVVLGATIAHKLFDDNAPLGEVLHWRGQNFVVAGVYDDFNAPLFSLEANFNNAVFVPYSTAQHLSNNVLGIYEIIAKSNNGVSAKDAVAAVQAALNKQHGGANDTLVRLASESSTASNQTLHLLTVLVTGAAIIALVVGGVGIMDVMLVSVTERMHEIGLRKAIGATNRQILWQFVAEALVLSGAGAVVGLVGSLMLIGLMHMFTSVHPVLVWQAFVLAPLAAVAIGVLFGTAPAIKAARKDPIEALRHE